MTELGDVKIFGTLEGSDKSLKLDEISILGRAEVIRALGVFLINAAYEMDVNEAEHVHLQDSIANFSYENHVDVIVINQEKVKLADS
ncbi:Imm32 family immunity protein [Burkholderia ambifaria]